MKKKDLSTEVIPMYKNGRVSILIQFVFFLYSAVHHVDLTLALP
jgi:hypothetical protein